MVDLLLCIQWLLYAQRPLTLAELYLAVVAGVSPTCLGNRNAEQANSDDMRHFVLNASKGLAEIHSSRPRLDETVQFIHESVRDFLVKDNGLHELWPDLGEDLETSSHERLKQCCYTYIKYGTEQLMSDDTSPSSAEVPAAGLLPFLEYAVEGVFYHTNEAALKGPQSEFLHKFPLTKWLGLCLRLCVRNKDQSHITQTSTMLYVLAERNYSRLIRSHLLYDPEINVRGGRHGYPLLVALKRGHKDTSEAILQTKMLDLRPLRAWWPLAKPHTQTQLSWAASRGFEELVRLLVRTGQVDVNERDSDSVGRTPLISATLAGHSGIVRLLLDAGNVDVNAKDPFGWSALSLASARGHETIVRLLLQATNIEIEAKDWFGQTALSKAMTNGHGAIVQLLLNANSIHNS